MEVDGRVRLASRGVEAGSSGEDDIAREVLVLANLLNRSFYTSQSGGRDDREKVLFRSSEPLKLLIDTRAGLQGSFELGNDSVLLSENVLLEVLRADLDVIALLQRSEHASEVLTNEFLDESIASEANFDIALFADFVDEVGASLEGEFLGKNEGVVAIEEEGVDLILIVRAVSISIDQIGTYLRHRKVVEVELVNNWCVVENEITEGSRKDEADKQLGIKRQ